MNKKFIESVNKLNGITIRKLIDYTSTNGTDVSDNDDCYTLQCSFVPTGYVPAIDTVRVRVTQIDDYTTLFIVRYENDVLMRAAKKYNYHPLQREFKIHSNIKLSDMNNTVPDTFESLYQKWCKETADKIRAEIVVAHAYIEEYIELQEIEKQIAAEQEEEKKKNAKEDVTSNYLGTNENTFSDSFDTFYSGLKALRDYHNKIFKVDEAEDNDADDESPYIKGCDNCSIKEECSRLKDQESYSWGNGVTSKNDITAYELGEYIMDYITPTLLMSLHQKLISSKGSQKTITVDIAQPFMNSVFSNINVCLRENRLTINTAKPDNKFNGNYVLEVYDRKTHEIRWKQIFDVSELCLNDIDPYDSFNDHTKYVNYENNDSITYRSYIFDALYDLITDEVDSHKLGAAMYEDEKPNNNKINYWVNNIELYPTF